MIPDIETILAQLVGGKITHSLALAWVNKHIEIAEQQGQQNLRDQFASAALYGMHSSLVDQADWPSENAMVAMAKIAYQQADAMLEARKK